VSEYQYYDFRALDRPLTRNEMATLRSISTRAAITATSFTNHYEWGDQSQSEQGFGEVFRRFCLRRELENA
jgi:hypothetical protein